MESTIVDVNCETGETTEIVLQGDALAAHLATLPPADAVGPTTEQRIADALSHAAATTEAARSLSDLKAAQIGLIDALGSILAPSEVRA